MYVGYFGRRDGLGFKIYHRVKKYTIRFPSDNAHTHKQGGDFSHHVVDKAQ